MKNKRKVKITKVKWSRPMGLKELSQIFDVHTSTMSKWLKERVICNRQLSPRRWEVDITELPHSINIHNHQINSKNEPDDFL